MLSGFSSDVSCITSATDSSSPVDGAVPAVDLTRSAAAILSARAGMSETRPTWMSDSFPSSWAVAYTLAPRLSEALAHRDPSESQGGEPDITRNGRRYGSLKCE